MPMFPSGRADSLRQLPIETVRAIAILVLVSFHVIGGPENGRGLAIQAPHPLRYYADLLIDIRMPLFALIAGAVYALRPVKVEKLGSFLGGKFRRLALPGITAITLFVIMSKIMNTPDGVIDHPLDPYFRDYAIYWFLQAILVIFLVYGTLDIMTNGRILLPALILSALAVALGYGFKTDIMGMNRLTQLLFYFLLGVFFIREFSFMAENRRVVLAGALVTMGLGLALNIQVLMQTGAFSAQRLDLQSLLFGAGACVSAFLLLPRLGWLQWLGAYSLTIYLYHIFATSAARRAMEAASLSSPWLQVLIGTCAGIALPVLLQIVARRWRVTRLLVLGMRGKPAMRDLPPGRKRQPPPGRGIDLPAE